MVRFLFIVVFLWAGGMVTFYFARRAWRKADSRKRDEQSSLDT